MAQTPDTIGNWTSTQFLKTLRDYIQRFPPDHLTSLTVDDLIVAGTLVARGNVTYSSKLQFSTVGASGQPAAFLNGWVKFGTPYLDPAYIKTEDGWVRMRGAAKSGSVTSALTILPPGSRPAATVSFAVAGNGLVGFIDIQKDGQVIPQAPLTNVRVHLDGIQFKAL